MKKRCVFLLATAFCAGPAFAAEPADMIEVDVQVLEVDKSRLTQVGLDWQRLLEGTGVASPLSPLNLVESGTGSLTRLGTFERGRVDAFVRMMQENEYGKLLAKPKLLTLSGALANFLAGGEMPVVNQDTLGHTSVTWKEYGVKLSIKPERKEAAVRTHVRAESSVIDDVHAVRLPNGTYIPAIKTRWVETDVEVPARATIIVAGLIQTENVKTGSGVPLLCDLPLLGWLFRYSRMTSRETEIVIFLTPSFVIPQAGA